MFPRLLRQKKSFGHQLGSPRYYRRAIEQLHRKRAAQTYGLYEVQPGGYTLAQAYFERRRLARILARTVGDGDYSFSPAKMNTILVDDKSRQICSFTLMDRIVHGAAYLMLAENLQARIDPSVYSYIGGRSKFQALDALADYVRAHRAARPDPRTRGLYALRCDVKSYCYSIPVGMDSPLWRQLTEWLKADYRRALTGFEKTMLIQLICPVLVNAEGGAYHALYGAPLGSPLSVLVMNMYLAPLDAAAAQYGDGFYARYGDDMVFLHPDPARFAEAEQALQQCLHGLQLSWNANKTKRLFFNAAGRSAPGIKGTPRIEFLGYSIAFTSALTLKSEMLQLFLREMRQRIEATHRVLRALPFEERGRGLCRMLNDALDPRAPHSHRYAAVLLHQTNDNTQLRQIDYLLARMVLRAMTGQHGIRAFRQLPYRKLRDEWHLRSLEHARNY